MSTKINSALAPIFSRILRRDQMAIACVGVLMVSVLLGIGDLRAFGAAGTPKKITTCTNIKTNVMRLLTKGVCNKKTEKTLIWVPNTPVAANPGNSLSELPNKAKYDEYFSDIYLGKMDIGKVIGTDGFPTKTSTFTKAVDQFCSMMTLKKTISAGHIGNAFYDVVAKRDIQPKSIFPMELAAGGSGGCNSLNLPTGKYEDKIYIDDVLVAVLPFEVK
jgi:hypothetical protein